MADTAIPIEWEGETYRLDLARFTVKQAIVIEGYTGMKLAALLDQIGDLGGDADPPDLLKIMVALYWLMRAQAGKKEPIADADFELIPFVTALSAGLAASGLAEDAEDEPDPTPPSPPPGRPSRGPSTRPATTRKRRTEEAELPATA